MFFSVQGWLLLSPYFIQVPWHHTSSGCAGRHQNPALAVCTRKREIDTEIKVEMERDPGNPHVHMIP